MLRYGFPHTIDEYIVASGEPDPGPYLDLPELDPTMRSLRAFNMRKPWEYFQRAKKLAGHVRLLARADLESIWPNMPKEEPGDHEDASEREVKAFEDVLTANEHVRGNGGDGTEAIDSLAEKTLQAVSRYLVDGRNSALLRVLSGLPQSLLCDVLLRSLQRNTRARILAPIARVAIEFSELTTLDLEFCSALNDSTFSGLSKNTILESIRISNNPNITAVGLNAIADACARLTNLQIARCPAVVTSQLAASTQALMSFSQFQEGYGMDIFIIVSPGQQKHDRSRRTNWKIHRKWFYGIGALHFILRALAHLQILWMDFGESLYFSPFGGPDPSDEHLNNIQTSFDNIPGFLTLDSKISTYGDLWELRRDFVPATWSSGPNVDRLSQNLVSAPVSGSLVIDLRSRAEGVRKYGFVPNRGSLGIKKSLDPLTPLSAAEFLDAFLPSSPSSGSIEWMQGRNECARADLISKGHALACQFEDFRVLTAAELNAIPQLVSADCDNE